MLILFPETSAIVKKISMANTVSDHSRSNYLINFAFASSYRGVFIAGKNAINLASKHKLSIIHVRSSAEFKDLLCNCTFFTLRPYGFLKSLSWNYIKLLCYINNIKLKSIILPIVLFNGSGWDKYLNSLQNIKVNRLNLNKKLLICTDVDISNFISRLNSFDADSFVIGEVVSLAELADKYAIPIVIGENLAEKIIWRYARFIDQMGLRVFISIFIKLKLISKSCLLAFEIHEN